MMISPTLWMPAVIALVAVLVTLVMSLYGMKVLSQDEKSCALAGGAVYLSHSRHLPLVYLQHGVSAATHHHCDQDGDDNRDINPEGTNPMSIEENMQTPEGFRKWLETKKAVEVVGTTRNCRDCPLANYINSLDPNSGASVGYSYYTIEQDKMLHDNPDWAASFVQRLDDSMVYSQGATAEECIDVLNTITE